MNQIKALRERLGMTQAQLALLCETSQPQIQQLESGDRQLSIDWAEKIAPHLGVTPAVLMFGPPEPSTGSNGTRAGDLKRSVSQSTTPARRWTSLESAFPANARLGSPLTDVPVSIPVYGQAVGGIDGEFVMNGDKLEDVFCPPSLSSVAGAYAVYVAGDSMEPRYFDGEIVYVNPRKRVRSGDFIVAQVQEEEAGPILAYVKRFLRWNAEELVLTQYNPEKELSFLSRNVKSVHLVVMGGAA